MNFLGVDGGGTKTAFVLINEEGKIIADTNGSTCNYLQIGFDSFKSIIAQGIEQICEEADIKISDIDFSCVGIPSYGEINEDIPILDNNVKEVFNNDKFICVNDVEVGWGGSLACEPGINLVAGTGAIGFGMDQHSNTARSSGWGDFCGDEGSCYWMGKKLIEFFSKQADGRLEKSILYDIVRKEFGITKDLDFISVVYNKLGLKRDNIAKLQILLNKAAEQGDINAIKAYEQAAYELSLIVSAIKNMLNFDPDKKIKVSYSGGIFKAGELVLGPFKKYIGEGNVVLSKPLLKPVLGAALIALKEVKGNIADDVVKELMVQQESM